MLPFTELPPSVIKELGLYVKVNTPNLLEYAFIDITQTNQAYNSHLIWHDENDWYVAHDIYVFQSPEKFEWCYFSADNISTIEEARLQLIKLKSNYLAAVKRYKESLQIHRLSKLEEDFND